jgi:hypothetical protein
VCARQIPCTNRYATVCLWSLARASKTALVFRTVWPCCSLSFSCCTEIIFSCCTLFILLCRAAERSEILARLDELKAQKTKTDYLAMIPKFITAATSIGHIIAPYLPALMEKAEQLARG